MWKDSFFSGPVTIYLLPPFSVMWFRLFAEKNENGGSRSRRRSWAKVQLNGKGRTDVPPLPLPCFVCLYFVKLLLGVLVRVLGIRVIDMYVPIVRKSSPGVFVLCNVQTNKAIASSINVKRVL